MKGWNVMSKSLDMHIGEVAKERVDNLLII
jgi:hypothetical protein